ncbi:hypothetical protein, partial [Burkholderia pseudomallei]
MPPCGAAAQGSRERLRDAAARGPRLHPFAFVRHAAAVNICHALNILRGHEIPQRGAVAPGSREWLRDAAAREPRLHPFAFARLAAAV